MNVLNFLIQNWVADYELMILADVLSVSVDWLLGIEKD